MVTDSRNNRLQVFDLDGTYLDRIGNGGVLNESSMPGQLVSPTAIAFASDGSMYVVDENRTVVQHFDLYGVFLGSLPLPADGFGAEGIAIDSNDNVFVSVFGTIMLSHRMENPSAQSPFLARILKARGHFWHSTSTTISIYPVGLFLLPPSSISMCLL